MATLTRIFGFLYNSAGQVITTGKITMQLQQDMVSVDGTKVAPFTITADLSTAAGFFEKYVYATVGASPAGLSYYVEFDPTPSDTTKPPSQKDGYWRNYWAVPNTASVPLGNFVSAHRGEPLSNYMPLGGTLVNPELPDNITLGLTPSGSSKSVIASQTAGANPTIRYNGTSSYWDLSQDGTTYRRIVTGTGTTGALTKWSAAGVLADSIISESGTIATIANTLKVSTITTPTATDLTLSPAGQIVIAKDIVPSTPIGLKIGSPTAKLGPIYASELWIDTLVKQQSLATVGGRITVAPTTSLALDLAAGASIASFTENQPDDTDILYMEDSGAAEYMRVFAWAIEAPFAARVTCAATASATLTTSTALAGTASVTATTAADLAYARAIATATSVGALTTAIPMQAAAICAASASGALTNITSTMNWFEVAGDYTTQFTPGRQFTVRGSTSNNAIWTTAASAYQAASVRTRIYTTLPLAPSTVQGYVAYLDNAPFVYRVVRNLEGGTDAWRAGDALLNTGTTGDGFLEMHSGAGLAGGLGPTIVANARTGTTYTNIATRMALGNLNGLYGYVTDTYGTAFGDPAGSWIKIDATNGVRLGYNTTTKVQIDTAGVASFNQGALSINSSGIVVQASGGSGAVAANSYQFGGTTGTIQWGGYTDNTAVLGAAMTASWTGAATRQTVLTFKSSFTPTASTERYVQLSLFGSNDGGQLQVTGNDIATMRATVSGTVEITTNRTGYALQAVNLANSSVLRLAGAGVSNGSLTGILIVQSQDGLEDAFAVLGDGSCRLGHVRLRIPYSTDSQRGHLQRVTATNHQTMLGHNLSYDTGVGFVRDDTSVSGWMIRLQGSTDGDFIRFESVALTAGANTVTPVTKAYIDASGNIVATSGVYATGGTLVASVNGGGVYVRNVANTADLQCIGIDNSNFTFLHANSAKLRFVSAVTSTAALGTYAGKINVAVDGVGTNFWIPFYN